MSDRQCETCRWWDAPPSWRVDQRGTCLRVMPGHAPEALPYISAAEAHTRLRTPPDFGCSLWEGDHE